MKYCVFCKKEKSFTGMTTCRQCYSSTTTNPDAGIKNRCVMLGCYANVKDSGNCICKNHHNKWRKTGSSFPGWAEQQKD